ncbi:MAG: hypothetical protein F2534_15065 [Actinobacteria bacterium]|nr:hypothetical protein [Actinomycetota bacterium]
MHPASEQHDSPIIRPITLEDRVAAIEAALAGPQPEPTPEPQPTPAEIAASRRAALAGGLRIVSVPTAEPVPGIPYPRPGVDISVTDPSGTPMLLRLTAGLQFAPGTVADQIEAGARGLGVVTARIPAEETR